jgi:hypothetical protein
MRAREDNGSAIAILGDIGAAHLVTGRENEYKPGENLKSGVFHDDCLLAGRIPALIRALGP